MSDPRVVPSLDQVAAQPEILRGLPKSVVTDIAFKALQIVVAAQISQGEAEAPKSSRRAPDEPLDVETAAERLGISPASLYRRAKTTYASLVIPTGTRNLRFSAAAIEAYKRRRRA